MISLVTRQRRSLGDTGSNLYRVEKGDSLSLITWKYGRPGADVIVLWSVNSGQIGQNPDNLKAGWTLALPEGWPRLAQRPTALEKWPTRAWVDEAKKALAEFGVTYSSKPPKPGPDEPPAPLVPPEETRPREDDSARPSRPGWLSYLRRRDVQLGLAGVVAAAAGLWWWSSRDTP